MPTLKRNVPRVERPARPGGDRPVLLATLEAPFDDDAAAFAVDAAVECGQQLIVANVVEIPLAPMSVLMGYGALEPAEEDAARLRAPAELASALGVPVERLRVCSPHPVDALLELVAERRPGLLVFGPDRSKLKPRAFRKVAKKIRDRVTCLVWLAD